MDSLLSELSIQSDFTYGEILGYLERLRKSRESPTIPLSIFTDRSLGFLEALTKFLREEHGLGYSEIASLLERDERTIWSSYAASKRKRRERFSRALIQGDEPAVSVSIFSDRRFGPLEALARHLRERQGLSYAGIAILLNRDSRTIWTACRRARGKAGPPVRTDSGKGNESDRGDVS